MPTPESPINEHAQSNCDQDKPAPPATERRSPSAGAGEIRVLHIVNGEHFSGAERVQSHLGRCLPEFGVAADFVSVKPGRFSDLIREHAGSWGRGFEAPMRGRLDLSPAISIGRLVRRERHELLHAHTPRTAMIASLAARMAGVPWVYHVHSPAARDSSRRWINRVNSWTERLVLRSCSHLICVSKSLRADTIARGYAAANVSVVHNGVPAIRPPRLHTPSPQSGVRQTGSTTATDDERARAIRNAARPDAPPWTLGMVALMRPRKGLEVILNALKIVRQAGFDVRLRCIGPFETEDYQTHVNALIEKLDLQASVEQRGFTEDVPRALADLDAMVLPSLFGEGLPMVVLEAMAAGLPVIATRVEGTPEAIDDGVEGLIAEPNNAASLAEKIMELVSGKQDWSQTAESAVQRHAREFSDQAMAQGTAAVYRQVLNARILNAQALNAKVR